jgi:hypothetical protein
MHMRPWRGRWPTSPEHQARHLAAATDQPDEGIATRLEQCARHMAHRGNAAGAIAALTRAADLSPGTGDRRRRLAEAAYIGSDLTWRLPASITPPGSSPDAEPEAAGALHLAAATAAAAVTTGSQDIDTIHRHLLAAIEAHSGSGDPADDGMAAAVTTLTTVCLFGGRAELWDPCRAALARLGSDTPRGVRLQAGLQGKPGPRSAAPAARPGHGDRQPSWRDRPGRAAPDPRRSGLR